LTTPPNDWFFAIFSGKAPAQKAQIFQIFEKFSRVFAIFGAKRANLRKNPREMRNYPMVRSFPAFGILVALFACHSEARSEEPTSPIDFARQVRPLLANHCFACHGQDSETREAGLRLDERVSAIGALESGARAIVPGDVASSTLVQRIESADPDLVMPPPAAKKPLSDGDKQLLRRWIAEGAKYNAHWAFVPPTRPEVPKASATEFRIENPIDAFVADKLWRNGMEMSPEAERATLVRRLSLDLTGLPPTIAEVDAFLADTSPKAYESLVDRMLASPHYGEKMAQDWLDLARFGDTNGYQDDAARPSYPYRDHAIAAFNANQPFDQFTIEQLAGDLLPNATLAQRVASGFNRHHRQNEEGGSDPEEFLVVYAVDRTNTVATTWMGLTLGCAQCHDHKYDPITQREYYRLYAFFNSLKGEIAINNKDPSNNPPQISLPTAEQKARMDSLAAQISAVDQQLKTRQPEQDRAFATWLQEAESKARSGALLANKPAGMIGGVFERTNHRAFYADTQLGGTFSLDQAMSASGQLVVTASINNHINIGHFQAGNATAANLLGIMIAEGPRLFAYVGLNDGTRVGADPIVLEHGRQYDWSYRWDPQGGVDDPADADNVGEGLLTVSVTHEEKAVGTLNVDLTSEQRSRGAVFDAFGVISGFFAGKDQPITLYLDNVTYSTPSSNEQRRQSFDADPGWTGFGNQENAHKFGYQPQLAMSSLAKSGSNAISAILLRPEKERKAEEQTQLLEYFRRNVDTEGQTLVTELRRLQSEHNAIKQAAPSTLVWEEMEPRRPAFVLARGDFEQRRDEVQPGVPAFLPPLPTAEPVNRLTLARWLVSPEHPLTARVTVNRLWKQFFGVGLVKTAGDFGTQGELPSHPELLDWLATQLIADGWDLKKCQKRILMSATYRQRAQATPDAFRTDPENRLLARGSRFRLSAEEVRDAALSISGLLVRTIGGPSVYPYQPASFYGDKSKDWTWPDAQASIIYRRGLYTFWRRTTLYPSLQTFDAPARGECTVSRPRTNTPLQALVTMNDPVFVEAARVFGERILTEGGDSNESRITFAMRTAMARKPTTDEMRTLVELIDKRRARYRSDPAAAKGLVSHGKSPRKVGIDDIELAAWTSLASVLLNLDETITRE
jgi:hypothetical protein